MYTYYPSKNPSQSPILIIHLPRPGSHGDLALDGVDAVADGGEDDEEDDDDYRDGDVALDHCCGGVFRWIGWLVVVFSLTVWREVRDRIRRGIKLAAMNESGGVFCCVLLYGRRGGSVVSSDELLFWMQYRFCLEDGPRGGGTTVCLLACSCLLVAAALPRFENRCCDEL